MDVINKRRQDAKERGLRMLGNPKPTNPEVQTDKSPDVSDLRRQVIEAQSWADEHIQKVRELMLHLSIAPAELGTSAAYHLSTEGQCLRARLALLTCRALGVNVDAAISMGAICELIHNASLVHDDIQDGDAVRRNRPSVWSRFGVNTAITLGDLLLTLAFAAVAATEIPHGVRSTLLELVARRTSEVIRGQALELELSYRTANTLELYEEMARMKTGSLLALAVEGPMVMAVAELGPKDAAHKALMWFGLAYQIRDDIFDFIPKSSAGAPGSDLRAGRINSVVCHYLRGLPEGQRDQLMIFLDRRNSEMSYEGCMWLERIRSSNAIASAISHFYAACHYSRQAARSLPATVSESLNEIMVRASASLDAVDIPLRDNSWQSGSPT